MVVLKAQSCLPPRREKALEGVAMASTSRGLAMPASITRIETLGFSARRPATTFPAVPPPTTMKSKLDGMGADIVDVVGLVEVKIIDDADSNAKEATCWCRVGKITDAGG